MLVILHTARKICTLQAIRLKHIYRVQVYCMYSFPGVPKAISLFQAAGVKEAIHSLPLPHMCIAFCSAHGIESLHTQHALCAKQSLALFNSCVTASLEPYKGYRCKVNNRSCVRSSVSCRAMFVDETMLCRSAKEFTCLHFIRYASALLALQLTDVKYASVDSVPGTVSYSAGDISH